MKPRRARFERRLKRRATPDFVLPMPGKRRPAFFLRGARRSLALVVVRRRANRARIMTAAA
uniref:Uncharacterized protein n=1 Tax=Paraburkholderia sprentiae WSM5005 TaxID=754502 RepID=A0A1I9YCV5_9BURK